MNHTMYFRAVILSNAKNLLFFTNSKQQILRPRLRMTI